MKTGDIFYTHESTSTEYFPAGYYVYKVLDCDKEFGILHVLGYAPVSSQPTKDDISSLAVRIYHMSILADGFGNTVLLDNRPVQDDELIGYHEYLKDHKR